MYVEGCYHTMSTPSDPDRPGDGDGPYLRRRVNDPVDWYSWGRGTLETARREDVPIFLSIGYATSHWCHAMAEESFRDDGVAELLNEAFVPVVVDRDRRPDLDLVYQAICRVATGDAGWPLSAWLTPAGKPFYVGTYFPPEHEDWAPGFTALLELIAEKWHSEPVREALETRAEEWAGYAAEALSTIPDTASTADDRVDRIADLAVRTADTEHGGWGTGAKFPEAARIELLCAADGEGRRSVATRTLDAMADGALHDHLGGGFFRSCADREWTEPVCEKTLPVNAAIARAFLVGYRSVGDPCYADAVRGTVDFLDRELSVPGGGYRAGIGESSRVPPTRTVDGGAGDGGGIEEVPGAYYGWTVEEAESVLQDTEAAALVCDRFGIDGDAGEPRAPRIAASIDELASAHSLEPEEVEERLDRARRTLRAARAERPAPRRDDRLFVGWNGFAVRTLAEGAEVLSDDDLSRRATETLRFVRDRVWDGERLEGRYVDDDGVHADAYLDDYAFVAAGALACVRTTGDDEYGQFAEDVGRGLVETFHDDGRLSFVPRGHDHCLLTVPQPTGDRILPSSVAVSIEVLATLERLTDDDVFEGVAGRVLETYSPRIDADLLQHHTLALVGRRARADSEKII